MTISTRTDTTNASNKPWPGFALVVTLTLLILLTLIAVGLLTLSSIALRSGARENASQQARANARMALMIALGELQKHVGPDQRVTATASILDESASSASINPHWTGVWDSWAAGKQADGSPTRSGNDVPSEHSTIIGISDSGLAPSYEEGRQDHFRRWLVSLPEEAANRIDGAKTGLSTAGNNAVRLVGPGSLGSGGQPADEVSAALMDVGRSGTGSPEGRFAWWVGDESVKAPILPLPELSAAALSQAELVERAQSPAQTHHSSIDGLDDLVEESIDRLVSRRTLDLISGDGSDPQRAFHQATPWSLGVLADIREGGLKRDLNALLDRPIRESDSGDEFMLYRFSNDAQARVPIQDLSAYYQLYRQHLVFESSSLQGAMQVKVPDFNVEPYRRSYSYLYRMPVPVKVQFLLSTIGRPRTPTTANPDPYKLHIGITPAITLWNPYNVPLTLDASASKAIQLRFFNLPLAVSWTKNGTFKTEGTSLSWITSREKDDGGDRYTGFTGWIAGTQPVTFEPGEVRVFSLQNNSLKEILNSNFFVKRLEMDAGWNPNVAMEMVRSTRTSNARNVEKEPNQNLGGALTFSPGDRISFSVSSADSTNLAEGAALQFFLRQGIPGGPTLDWLDRQFQMMSRRGTSVAFNSELMRRSFPKGLPNPDIIEFPALPGSQMASATPRPFLLVSLTAGCEVSTDYAGSEGGRRFVSRPFLHSSPLHTGPRIDRSDPDAFYQHGWNWTVADVNSALEASVQVAPDNRASYYGGGYTGAYGITHLVQQEIPLSAPISIGALSHARLGGWSLANQALNQTPPGTTSRYETVTATGSGGLFPHTLQAIGNSYAHPYIPPDQVRTGWNRQITETSGAHDIPLVDHSYLANKALWDEFFFSSLASRNTRAFAGTRTDNAYSLARKVFLDDEPLPNPRLVTIPGSLDSDTLAKYFTNSGATPLGERALASHLMLAGPFNVNSTSSAAWSAVLSSLRNHAIAVLTPDDAMKSGIKIRESLASGVPVAGVSLPNGEPIAGSPPNPADTHQWNSWRDLDDEEIQSLAEALVEQVRRRGPFLSLSEFVNRRLDSDPELALKGALQAALDDDSVSINEAFRTGERAFSPAELTDLNPAFPKALEGPIALGSNAYVDQADLLRNLGGILTPRGDTFVIRAYGEALDASGKVIARAWCEAIAQRIPEYLDLADEAQVSTSELKSKANEIFGRKIRVVSFRWLGSEEV